MGPRGGSATSTLERITLRVDGETRAFVVKASSTAFRGTTASLPLFRTEAVFYRDVLPVEGFAAPDCILAEVSADGAGGYLVLTDVSPDGRSLDPIGVDELYRTVSMLARLHRRTWGRPYPLPVHGYLVADTIDVVWGQLRSAVFEQRPAAAAHYDDVFTRYPAVLHRVHGRPTCVVHGDATARNLLRAGPGSRESVFAVDFATATIGIGALDIARLASECDQLRTIDDHRAVVAHWRRELGIREYGSADAWADYLCGLALAMQFAMFEELPPWPDGPRHEAYLRAAAARQRAAAVCELSTFLAALP